MVTSLGARIAARGFEGTKRALVVERGVGFGRRHRGHPASESPGRELLTRHADQNESAASISSKTDRLLIEERRQGDGHLVCSDPTRPGAHESEGGLDPIDDEIDAGEELGAVVMLAQLDGDLPGKRG